MASHLPDATDTPLARVNHLRHQLAGFLRTIVDNFDDGHLSLMEGIEVGKLGISLASTVIATLKDADEATRREMVRIVEHGELMLPPDA
jgi:hypothetical protein